MCREHLIRGAVWFFFSKNVKQECLFWVFRPSPNRQAVVNGNERLGSSSASLPRKNRCNCCPYGYHIDLDFIQYCESVSSGAYLKQLRKLKKYKRKQRKSLEIMLGLAAEKKDDVPKKYQIDEVISFAVNISSSPGLLLAYLRITLLTHRLSMWRWN